MSVLSLDSSVHAKHGCGANAKQQTNGRPLVPSAHCLFTGQLDNDLLVCPTLHGEHVQHSLLSATGNWVTIKVVTGAFQFIWGATEVN